jgi:hypothetical protein
MRIRKLVIATHRDVGYFVAGLTIMYAISGIAVNHIDDWNPSWVVTVETHHVGTLPEGNTTLVAGTVLDRLGITDEPTSVVRTSPGSFKVFFEGRTLTVHVAEGRIEDEHARRRAVFFHLNYLHLNHGKGLWTWLADAYAVALVVLAGTGIFIITGRKGLGGRGLWLLLIGLAIPLVYLVWRL